MSSQPAAMAEAVTSVATPLLRGLPDEVVIWEILVRLDPESLLRCRAVRRAWRRVTSTRRFLLAHHARHPTFPIMAGDQLFLGVHHHDILAFDHRAAANAQLRTVARLDQDFYLEASCDGLLVLSNFSRTASGCCISICNPATREHASVGPQWDFSALGMYPHRHTGEYRLLLYRGSFMDWRSPENQTGCYVLPLGSDQPPRYIGWPETDSGFFNVPVLLRDNLHWYPYRLDESNHSESKPIIVFDTIAESFRKMQAPIVPTKSYVFEMDGTLGIYYHDDDKNTWNIWVLQDYESEFWDLKYRIKLPVEEIRERFEGCEDYQDVSLWNVDVVSGDGGVLLLVSFGQWVLHIDTDGKLIDSFNCDLLDLRIYECQLKQSLVQHTFFPALKGYVVNASPFI